MTPTLLSLRQAAPLLGCRDPRTARRRLAIIGCPVVHFGSRVYVDRHDLARALRARTVAEARRTTGPAPAGGGVTLPAGERLWDGAPALSGRWTAR